MIYVIRHGQTDFNKEGRMQGRKGLPLNEEGLRQANVLKEKLKDVEFHYVFSSPQERAVQTAEIISGFKSNIDERLDVFDLGEADGLKKEEVIFKGAIPDPTKYVGVEGMDQFAGRVTGFLKSLEDEKYVGMNILIAGHRCTTGVIGAYLKGVLGKDNVLKYSSDNGDYKVYNSRIVS
ncbi:histidine phosphatase family protein [Sutcliffiella horikoshii]|uniref:histidine phosphatase family protein n=1 Tax=Sutcliffiella horikoshii TaxID=79883 RepID=UPI001CFEA33B|nr:histidine phosphatase family protein [Sutcliffiella horikoshii]